MPVVREQPRVNPLAEEPVVELTRWAVKWLKFAYDRVVNGTDVHQCATGLLKELDSCEESPEEFVETHEVTLTKTVDGEKVLENKKVTKRLAKGKRSKFAMCVAKAAYLKFGRRNMSEANLLVTRKWIVKFLEDPKYVDLRVADKCIAVDRALFLSFVPTMVYNDMKIVSGDKAVEGRISGVTTSFGKVFSVRRAPIQ